MTEQSPARKGGAPFTRTLGRSSGTARRTLETDGTVTCGPAGPCDTPWGRPRHIGLSSNTKRAPGTHNGVTVHTSSFERRSAAMKRQSMLWSAVCAVTLAGSTLLPAKAATVAYWRFEAGPAD